MMKDIKVENVTAIVSGFGALGSISKDKMDCFTNDEGPSMFKK